MPDKAPAFQFYPDKWLAGTEHLSDAAYRGYHHILCWMWLHAPDQCSMRNTDSGWQLATAIKDKAVLGQVRAEIMNPDFQLLMPMHGNQHSSTGGALVSLGLRKESSKLRARRKQMQDAAKKRWNKDNGHMPTDMPKECDTALLRQCSPTPTPTPLPKGMNEDNSYTPPTPRESQPNILETEKFKAFWKAYGKDIGRGKCWNLWYKNKLEGIADQIMAGLRRWKNSDEWASRRPEYPFRWLDETMWKDNPPKHYDDSPNI